MSVTPPGKAEANRFSSRGSFVSNTKSDSSGLEKTNPVLSAFN